jgi:hypothetical protein
VRHDRARQVRGSHPHFEYHIGARAKAPQDWRFQPHRLAELDRVFGENPEAEVAIVAIDCRAVPPHVGRNDAKALGQFRFVHPPSDAPLGRLRAAVQHQEGRTCAPVQVMHTEHAQVNEIALHGPPPGVHRR